MTVAPDGTLTMLQLKTGDSVVQRAPDGTLTTLAFSSMPVGVGLASLGANNWVTIDIFGRLYRLNGSAGTSTQIPGVTVATLGNVAFGTFTTSPDGFIYAVDGDYHVVRIAPDNTVAIIAGYGGSDPGGNVYTGPALLMPLSPAGLAVTPNSGLLISSGNVVYRLNDPEHA